MPARKHKSIDIGKALLYGAALFQAYQYGRALNVYDPQGLAFWHVNVGGFLLGALINLIVAVSATELPVIRAKGRRRWGWTAFFALLALSPALVAPAMNLVFRDVIIKGAGWLAVGIALAPDLAIALGGFIAGGALISLGATQSERSASAGASSANAVRTQSERSASVSASSASAVRSQCEQLATQYACTETQCDWSPSVDALVEIAESGKDPKRSASSAKAGHYKSQHKPIVVDQSLLLKKD